ncbi:YaaC family protein [Aureibacillus halotolerans]|uniref:YaaC-like protein n=1 Tax=Aureibacillus halotolerans TaxID=1508390 RepID=A0A4R6TZL6_9BACI|nr:YaaC family protein [Aureibacillus halotolerans]TDQ38332.1 YaaC-like protein [Aureibacillus halotolerans]
MAPWQDAVRFQSAAHAQKYLFKHYVEKGFQEPHKLSYTNCYPFMHYLEHGRTYYEQAATAPMAIQPNLLFYGMVQILKACLLTVDPAFPGTTAVMAHGLTTRKRKKQQYEFLDDEVKVQKNGLLPHFSSHLFGFKQNEGDKYPMLYLLQRIPELHALFSTMRGRGAQLHLDPEGNDGGVFYHSSSMLDLLHMTARRYESFLQSFFGQDIRVKEYARERLLHLSGVPNQHPMTSAPLQFDMRHERWSLPCLRPQFTRLPEVVVHYMLLYNLSMIARYETSWWMDVLHSHAGEDFPYISEFLYITSIKMPMYLLTFLKEREGGSAE